MRALDWFSRALVVVVWFAWLGVEWLVHRG